MVYCGKTAPERRQFCDGQESGWLGWLWVRCWGLGGREVEWVGAEAAKDDDVRMRHGSRVSQSREQQVAEAVEWRCKSEG